MLQAFLGSSSMNRKTILLRKKLFFLLIPFLIGIAYLGSAVSSSSRKLTHTVSVKNYTNSCEVLSAEKRQGQVQVRIKNNNDKAITAFVMSSVISRNTVFKFEEEFAFSETDFMITPGEVYEKQINIPSSLYSQPNLFLNLLAVIFDDKSSEGDQTVVKEIVDKRLGEKIQLTRTLPFLEKMLALSDSDIQMSLMDLKSTLISTLDAPEKNLPAQSEEQNLQAKSQQAKREYSEEVETGLQTGQESVLRQFQKLEELQKTQRGNVLREEILRIKQRYERILSRL
jgi:hypothetical protein